jgi:uncharacterized protein YjbI with pentapeptide repeats
MKFGEDANFYETEFGREADFWKTKFGGKVDFRLTEFSGEAEFEAVEFSGKADFRLTEFRGKTSFSGAEFLDIISFTRTKFGDSPKFIDTNMSSANFEEAHLENADFERANLSEANIERAKLSNADLFGTDLSGAQLYGARIGGAVINTETLFDEKHHKYRCVYDPNSEYEYEYESDDEEQVGQLKKAMGAYHLLEQLTRANTLPDKQAKFFARRQDMRRAQLREDGRRLQYWFAEAQNAVFRHGESFSRVVAWAVGTIITFTFLYPIGGWLKKASTTGELQRIYTYDAIYTKRSSSIINLKNAIG